MPVRGTVTPAALGQFFVLTMAFSVVITWVFNRTGQSLPLIMLRHATYNNVQNVAWPEFFPGLDAQWTWGPVLGICGLAAALTVVTRGKPGYEPPRTIRAAARQPSDT